MITVCLCIPGFSQSSNLLVCCDQGRKTAAQVQRLEALHAKQQAVLRRKTEEAEAARKRLHVSNPSQQCMSIPLLCLTILFNHASAAYSVCTWSPRPAASTGTLDHRFYFT